MSLMKKAALLLLVRTRKTRQLGIVKVLDRLVRLVQKNIKLARIKNLNLQIKNINLSITQEEVVRNLEEPCTDSTAEHFLVAKCHVKKNITRIIRTKTQMKSLT